jgi:hypothetical protein
MLCSFSFRTLIELILVDGHTQPLEVQFPESANCDTRSCFAPPELGMVNNFTYKCPIENTWYLGGFPSGSANASQVAGCKSNCSILDTDAACCKGDFNLPSTCNLDSSPALAEACPRAYSYAYSDQDRSVVSQCCSESLMTVTFCPSTRIE